MSLGVALLDPPAAVCRDGRYDLFARGMDKGLYQNSFVNGRWSGWVAIGGSSTGQPAAVTTASGCLDVFMRGTDAQLWTRSFRSGVWGEWKALPGQGSANPGGLLSEPVAISVSASRIDVFVLGSDSALWHRRQVDGKWLPWVRLGAFPLTGKPSVCSSAPGQIDLAVISAEKALWYYRMNG